jgi:CelD/BcsL family acetyltransferase involved in cellulose biosynthesis
LSQSYWDWRNLFDRDPNASPLQHPDFVIAELTSQTNPRHEAVLISGDSSGDSRVMGVLVPKSIRTSRAGGLGPSWTLHGLRLAGGRFLTSDGSFEPQRRLLQAVTRYCADVGASFLLLEDLDEATALYGAIHTDQSGNCRLFVTHDYQPRRYIDFPASEADYWKTFSSRSLSKFRRNLKKFGETRLDRVTEIEQIPEFLRAAHEISKQSWQSSQFGLRIRNDDAEMRQLSALAQNNLLRSYLWWIEGQPAAFAVCNQHRGCFRYEEIAYCKQFGQFSPGRTMLHQIVEDLLRHDSPICLDFGGGDAEYKQQFSNRESRSGTVWLVPRTWNAGLTLTYLTSCRQVRAGFRSLIKRIGFGTRARQWIRSGGSSPAEEVAEPCVASAGAGDAVTS